MSLLGKDIEDSARQLTQTLRVAESALIDLRAVLAKLTVILEKIKAGIMTSDIDDLLESEE